MEKYSVADQQSGQHKTLANVLAAEKLSRGGLARHGMGGVEVPPPAPVKGYRARTGLIAGVVATAVAAALGSAWYGVPASEQGDVPLTQAALTERQSAFAAQGPVAFSAVPAAEQERALAGMKLSADEQAALTRDIARPEHRLVYITVWDDRVEDGDALKFESAGFTQQVALTKAPQRFAVPVSNNIITLRGVRDGGGGITLGAQADGGAILVPILTPGEAVDVPVRAP